MNETRLLATEADVAVAYRRAWHPVCRSQDLVGGPKQITLLGCPLVAFRGDDKKPYVMRNRCSHRGSPLHPGKVVGSEIECPYHGWRFKGATGACSLIPSSGSEAPVPPGARIAAYPAVEKYGLVWTCLDPIGLTFPEIPYLTGWDSWQSGTGRPIEVTCGIRHTVENFCDVAHFAFVHKRTMGSMDPRIEPLTFERGENHAYRMVRTYNVSGGFEEIWHGGMVFTYDIRPPAFICLTMAGSEGVRHTIHAAQPVDEGRSIIFFATAITPGWTGVGIAEAVEHEHVIYGEDVPLISQLVPHEAPLFGTRDLIHSPADKFTLGYRRVFAEWAREVADMKPPEAGRA